MPLEIKAKIDVSSFERRLTNTKKVLTPTTLQQAGQAAGRVVGTLAESYIRVYPPSPGGRPRTKQYTRQKLDRDGNVVTFQSQFKSLKQQRKVFALLREGKWPYVRTGHLGRTITHTVLVSEDGRLIIVEVGASAPYAKYVIGKEQAIYHAITGWETLPFQLQSNRAALIAAFRNTFFAFLNARLK